MQASIVVSNQVSGCTMVNKICSAGEYAVKVSSFVRRQANGCNVHVEGLFALTQNMEMDLVALSFLHEPPQHAQTAICDVLGVFCRLQSMVATRRHIHGPLARTAM